MADFEEESPEVILFTGQSLDISVNMVLKPKDLASKPSNDPVEEIKQLDAIQCGQEARKQFAFADGYRNLNHGMCE